MTPHDHNFGPRNTLNPTSIFGTRRFFLQTQETGAQDHSHKGAQEAELDGHPG